MVVNAQALYGPTSARDSSTTPGGRHAPATLGEFGASPKVLLAMDRSYVIIVSNDKLHSHTFYSLLHKRTGFHSLFPRD